VLKYLDDSEESVDQSDNQGDTDESIRHMERFNRLIKATHAMSTIEEIEPLLKSIKKTTVELTQTEACCILLYDEESGMLTIVASTFSDNENLIGCSVPFTESIAGWVFDRGTPILNRDVDDGGERLGYADKLGDFEVRSILSVPLKVGDRAIGILELFNKTSKIGFVQGDILIASTIASQAAIAIEHVQQLNHVEQKYHHLLELNRLKDNFLDAAVYELNTSLKIILGCKTALRNKTKPQQLHVMLDNANRLRSLIDDSLNVRYITEKEPTLNMGFFSMREMITSILNEFQPLISAKLLKIKAQFVEGNDQVNIEGDHKKIYIVIANLLSNAVQITPVKGIILVALGRKEQTVFIRIADTGKGMSKKELANLFSDKAKTELQSNKPYPGLGVGLQIVKVLVEAHDGDIQVSSQEGKGTQFTILLPVSHSV